MFQSRATQRAYCKDQHQKMRVPKSTPSCLEKCKFRETVSVHAGPSLLVTTAIPLSPHSTAMSRQVPEEIPKPSGDRKGSRPKAEVGVEGPQQGTWLWLLYPRTPPPAQTLQAALGSPLPAYRMLFPNIAVHRYGTVLISMPWASMFSAAIRPGRQKQRNKRGSSAPGQALWSALGSQHSINIFSPRVQGNQDLLLSQKKNPKPIQQQAPPRKHVASAEAGLALLPGGRAADHTRVARLAVVKGRMVSALQHAPGPAQWHRQPSWGCKPELTLLGCELLSIPGQGEDWAPAVTADAREHMTYGKAHPWAPLCL